MNPNIEFSIKTAQAYNAVCKPLCQELGLSQTALDILQNDRAKLDELAKYLHEKETITGEEFMRILNG